MTIKTLFSAYVIELKQLPLVFLQINEWSTKQDHDNWEKHVSYLSFEKEKIVFNFYVVNLEGLSLTQNDEVIHVLRSSGLTKITMLIDPRPASS